MKNIMFEKTPYILQNANKFMTKENKLINPANSDLDFIHINQEKKS